MSDFRVKTPCIGICSTTSLGDPICRGCKRFAFEVINWNGYGESEKLAVLDRTEALIVQIFSGRFHIRQPEVLKAAMLAAPVPFDAQRSAYTWLHNLLKKLHWKITDLHQYGVDVREPYRTVPLAQLIEQADQELLVLCEAHYSRYFALIP